jgi:hypothetical protein
MVNLDTGIIGLVIHFAINVISCALITYVVYVRRTQAKSYDFSFMMIATIIFFISKLFPCSLLFITNFYAHFS